MSLADLSIRNIAYSICNVPYHSSARDKVHFRALRKEESFWTKRQSCITQKVGIKSGVCFWFCLFYWMPFYLAWICKKGHRGKWFFLMKIIFCHWFWHYKSKIRNDSFFYHLKLKSHRVIGILRAKICWEMGQLEVFVQTNRQP